MVTSVRFEFRGKHVINEYPSFYVIAVFLVSLEIYKRLKG